MKKNNRFFYGIIGAIALYITVISSTANTTKEMGKNSFMPTSIEIVEVGADKEQKESDGTLKEEKVLDKEIKDNKKIEKNKEEIKKEIKKEVVLKDIELKDETVKTLEVVGDKIEVTEKPLVLEDVPVVQEVEAQNKDSKNYGYVLNYSTPVYSDIEKEVKGTTLKKATRVEILGDTTSQVVKESKVKKQDGSFETKKSVITKEWTEILYGSGKGMKKGWVKKGALADSRLATSPANLKNVDFSPIQKQNYSDNPKIEVRGIYVTVNTASSDKRMDELIAMAKRTGINAFVIDVKEDFGKFLFKTEAELKYLGKNDKSYPVSDIHKFLKKLKDNNIYTIARIVSFKDPSYAKKYPDKAIIKRSTGKPYTNSDGVIWVSPHDRYLWEYNIAVAKEAGLAGFNEVQLDYVRFPASNGGKLDSELDYRNTKGESKPETIGRYLREMRKALEPLHVYLSADIYGQVSSSNDDMGLGQHWEVVANVVDTVSPMAYPSHYGRGVYGLNVPDANPYKTIYHTTLDSINRNYNIDNPASIRPWLQAFTATWVKGHIPYGKAEIDAQIKALQDLGVREYLLWSPSNRYGILEK